MDLTPIMKEIKIKIFFSRSKSKRQMLGLTCYLTNYSNKEYSRRQEKVKLRKKNNKISYKIK
jgi:hypothetical protein